MSDSLVNEIKAFEQEVQAKKTEKVRLEERLKGLYEAKDKLLEELTALGLKEDDLLNEYDKNEAAIKETLEKAKEFYA